MFETCLMFETCNNKNISLYYQIMLYSNGKGKYEKAYNYLFKKMVPQSGSASNPLGEA